MHCAVPRTEAIGGYFSGLATLREQSAPPSFSHDLAPIHVGSDRPVSSVAWRPAPRNAVARPLISSASATVWWRLHGSFHVGRRHNL